MDRRSYLFGAGIGSIIIWVTGALAYYKAGISIFPTIIEFGVVVTVICFILAFLVGSRK